MIQHVEKRVAHQIKNHPIPPMTHPDGKYWGQPARALIEVDSKHALMSLATFKELREYSATNPTGVYEGKMWRRHDGSFDQNFLAAGGKPEWLLCWYGPSPRRPGWLTAESRKIILIDADVDGQY